MGRKVLVCQMGHVPRTSGSTGANGEQAMAKAVAAEVKRLTPPEWVVRVINADEPADQYRGSNFVAIHGDGNANRTLSGASVGYRDSEGKRLASLWKAAYVKRGWPYGFRDDNYTRGLHYYYGTGLARAVGNTEAFVVEVGFMSNPMKDRPWIDAHHTDIAKSIWDAVQPGWGGGITRRYPGKAVRQGHKDVHDVRWVQASLTHKGYRLVVDGDFGPKTAAAVAAFRKSRGWRAVGVVGRLTWAALGKA